jgi:hypothetical protein
MGAGSVVVQILEFIKWVRYIRFKTETKTSASSVRLKKHTA